MRLFLMTLCFTLFSGILFSQEVLWSKNYGGSKYDILLSIKKLDSTYIAMGHTESNDIDLKNRIDSAGITDGWILKIDSDGEIIWSKTYGGSGNDRINNVEVVADGLIFLGEATSNDIENTNHKGGQDVWILKTDFEGNIIWSKTFGSIGSERPLNFLLTEDSTLIVTASSNYKGGDVPANLGDWDLWVFEIDLKGEMIWSDVYGGSRAEPSSGGNNGYNSNQDGKITYVPDEGYIITCNSKSSNGDLDDNAGKTDNWVFCINKGGELKWSHSFGSEKLDFFVEAIHINGGLLLFSNTNSSTTGVTTYKMINDEFSLLNDIGKPGDYSNIINGERTIQNNMIFTGFTNTIEYDLHTFKGDRNGGWVTKLNSKAELVWSKNYGGSSGDFFHGQEVVDTTEILAVGFSNSNDYDLPDNYGNTDGWIIKIKDTCVTQNHEVDTFFCSDSYLLFHGDTIDQRGTYSDTFFSKSGCDSVITWIVEEKGIEADTTFHLDFCKSYTLPSDRFITNSGTYYDTLLSSSGCDSIVAYALQKVKQDTSFVELKVEEGQSITYRDTVFSMPGTYVYRKELASDCDSIFIVNVTEYKECNLYVPNAFSPNGDGVNDNFLTATDCHIFNFNAQIYSRWGQLITESRQPEFIWDGGNYPTGVYIYFITYEYESATGRETEKLTGSLTLIR